MKSEFKTKFLQHLIQKKENEGFTLIELLVVIIIIGILAAIALPSFLNQANKAKESEAKQYVGSSVRAQQAYFTENTTFTTDWGKMGLGVPKDTKNYKYSLENITGTSAVILGQPNFTNTLRGFVGGVAVGEIDPGGGGTKETTTLAGLCQSKKPQTIAAGGIDLATLKTGNIPNSCTGDYESVAK